MLTNGFISLRKYLEVRLLGHSVGFRRQQQKTAASLIGHFGIRDCLS